MAKTYFNLAKIYQIVDKNKVEEFCEKAIQSYNDYFAKYDDNVSYYCRCLIEVYQFWEKPGKVKEYNRKLISYYRNLLKDPQQTHNRENYEKSLAYLYRETEQFKLAIPLYIKFLNEAKYTHLRIDYLTILGEIYLSMSEYEKAKQYYLNILELEAGNKSALYSISFIYEKLGNMEVAKSYVERYVEVYPDDDPRMYTTLALFYDSKQEPYTVLKYLRKAVKVNNDKDMELAATIYKVMGNIYWMDLHDSEKAIESFRKMTACNPSEQLKAEMTRTMFLMHADPDGFQASAKFFEENFSPDNLPLMKPPLSEEEIKQLPYHYSKLPSDFVEKNLFLRNLRKNFENELLTNQEFKTYFDRFDPDSVSDFIREYAKYKTHLTDLGKDYSVPEEQIQEKYWYDEAEDIF